MRPHRSTPLTRIIRPAVQARSRQIVRSSFRLPRNVPCLGTQPAFVSRPQLDLVLPQKVH
jgi:hypothetical protein